MLTKLVFSCRFKSVIVLYEHFSPRLRCTLVIIYLNIVLFDYLYNFHADNSLGKSVEVVAVKINNQ